MTEYEDVKSYIIEIELNGEKQYIYSKRVAVYHKPNARKFSSIKGAKRFFRESIFAECKAIFEEF